MSALPQILLTVGVATLLALWCGWGLARLTLPEALKSWSGLLAPLMGYALVLVVGYWGVREWVGVPIVLMVILPVTGILNIVAWVRTGPPRLPQRPLQHVPLAMLLLVTLGVGVAPLLSYGHPAIIGEGWDVENYLPVARYLERGPVSAIATAPPNPLRDLNANPPSKGLTLGFSIWQGSVDLLTGQEAVATFSPLLAWLRMLGIVALYVLFRSTLGLSRWFALLGAAFAGASGLLLWVEYFNFGMQISAWPLIPLGLVVGIAAVREVEERGMRRWPALVGAAIALAALPVAYYPALTLFAPLAAGLGLATLVQSQRRIRLLAGGAALAGMALLLNVPSVLAYDQGFSFRYGQQLTSLGLFRYVPLTDFAGLTQFSLRTDPPVPPLSKAAFAVLCALMLAGLIWGRNRLHWAGMSIGGAAYMLWLLSQQYPYAWMKGGAYAAFPFLGLAAMGVQSLVCGRRTTDDTNYAIRSTQYASRFTFHVSRFTRWGAIAVSIAILFLMGVTQAQTVADHWQAQGLFAKELPAMLGLRARIPPGSHVTLTSDPRINGVTTALAAYMLDNAAVLGSASTGYVPSWSNGASDEIGDYALLLSGEDAEAYGFAGAAIWQGAGFTLYKRDPSTIAHLPLDRTLAPGETLNLPFDDKHLGEGVAQDGSYGPRTVVLALATLDAGKITVDANTYPLAAGGSQVMVEQVQTPHKLALRNDGASPVIVRWATLTTLGDVSQVEVDPTGTALTQAHAQARGTSVSTTIDALLPSVGPITIALDIWDRKRGAHYGWYGVEQARSEARRTFTLTLDLPTGTMAGTGSSAAPLAIGGGLDRLQQGDYTASLNVLAGAHLLAAPEEVFSFSVGADGEVSNVRATSTPLVAARGGNPPVFVGALSGDEEDMVMLAGYALDEESVRPGEEVSLTLWWYSYTSKLDERSILIHLLDAMGEMRAQADGPPANGSRPTTTWQIETVIDTHTLKIPTDLPAGQYNIAVGMYHYPSLEPVPFTQVGQQVDGVTQPAKPLEGNVVLIPLEIKP